MKGLFLTGLTAILYANALHENLNITGPENMFDLWSQPMDKGLSIRCVKDE